MTIVIDRQWNVDKICWLTKNATMLNALHACRDKHPLNNPNAWSNAVCIAWQHYEIPTDAIEWLIKQSRKYDSKPI